MNKTQNYQLNQWEAADKVRHQDFNADNAKIDAAIKAVDVQAKALAGNKADQTAVDLLAQKADTLEDKVKLHTIKTMTFSQTTSNAYVSLTGIDWSQWKIVLTVIQIVMNTGSCRIYPTAGPSTTTMLCASNNPVFVQFPMCHGELPFAGLLMADRGMAFNFGVSFQDGGGFKLSPMSDQVIESATATVYGIK